MNDPTSVERVYLDACSIIHWANPRSEYRRAVASWLEQGLAGQVVVATSTAGLIEARGGGHLSPNPEAEGKIQAILLSPMITLVDCTRPVALRARELAIDHHLATWDAVHLASALTVRANLLLTTDTDLLKIRHVDGVAIREPFLHGGEDLFGSERPDRTQ